jgi:hypothetical protein
MHAEQVMRGGMFGFDKRSELGLGNYHRVVMNWAKDTMPSSRQLEKPSAFPAYLAFGFC